MCEASTGVSSPDNDYSSFALIHRWDKCTGVTNTLTWSAAPGAQRIPGEDKRKTLKRKYMRNNTNK